MKETPQVALFEKASELFKKHGVKGLTMDDIAREMGMSKKTIYRFVNDKADLVRLAMDHYLKADQHHLEIILQKSENAVDEMINMIAYFINVISELDTKVLLDIQKHYADTWEMYNDYRYKYVLSLIAANMEKGKKEGYYREDFNPDVISKVFISAVDVLIDQRLFPSDKYVFINLYREFLRYHLCGVVSPKGLEYVQQHNLFRD